MSTVAIKTIGLLIVSNIFMTAAWYGHLKYRSVPLWKAILASWFIALIEYGLQVPANRLGYGPFSATDLKIMQEVITLVVFVVFSMLYLGEAPRWNHLMAFLFLVTAVLFAFWPAGSPQK